jgi:hypothetical protein
MYTLLDLINAFIRAMTACDNAPELQPYDMAEIYRLMDTGYYVDAIKYLRATVKFTEEREWSWSNTSRNYFVEWIQANDFQIGREKSLGLKEAKDIVDFIKENRHLV